MSFFEKHQSLWDKNENFQNCHNLVKSLYNTNDDEEKCVILKEEYYNKAFTKNEEQNNMWFT